MKKPSRQLFRGVHRSVWNFWRDGVSSSILSLFLQCREQARLELVEGWRPRTTPFYFAYGTCCHWILERAYQQPAAPGMKWLKARMEEFSRRWIADAKPTSAQTQQQELVYGMAMQQLPVYFKRWGGDWAGGKYPMENKTPRPVKWLGLEQRFRVPFKFSDGREMTVFGTRDGVFRDRHGEVWTTDHKFRSMIDDEVIVETLPFDLQQMLYLWASMQQGVTCDGCVLDVTRRPGIYRRKNEPLAEYLPRIQKDVADPKRWGHYFMRYAMRVTPDEVRDWGENVLRPLLEDVRAWWEGSAPHYLNPGALVNKYGRCATYGLIVRGKSAEPGYYRRKNVTDYQELLG